MPALTFNANNVAPSTGFDAIPAGKYQAVISQSSIKATRNGSGSYLELTFEIIDGEYKGRKLWSRLNIENPSQKAVAVAQSELSAICHAVGVLELFQSEQLHDLPMTITVRCVKNPDTDEMSNEIKGYAAPQTATPVRKAQAATPPVASNNTAPWKR